MAVAGILVLMSMVVSTQAVGCAEGQQCSDCSRNGHCESKCSSGYFGVKCQNTCSKACLHGACMFTETGIGRCTEGCEPGYRGIDCTTACDSQATTCSKCGSECKEGYCQLGSSCVSGCVDGYHGSDCKNCSSRCKTCNRITGTCDECYPLYTGPDCRYSGLCEAECAEGCGPQVSGRFCVEVCSHNCRFHNNMNDTRCLPPGGNAAVYCTSECHNQGGECLHGCVDGWYGPRCSSPCSAGCKDGRCDAAGACVDGCRSGYFGRDCEPCLHHCYNHTCSQHNGSCVDGCITGYSGEFCNETCDVCRDGVCDQMSGTCINGCDVNKHECELSCNINCSREYCTGKRCNTDWRVDGISVGIPTGCVLLVLAILMSNYVCYRKFRSANRGNLTHVEPLPAVEYQS